MIRKAAPADIPQLNTLIEEAVNGGDVLPRTLHELETLLDNCFVAVDDGRVVGMAILEIYSPKLAELRSLCVSPSARGKGYGRQLVDACADLAREHNILEVMAITRSEQFFINCGFDYTLPNLRKALFLPTREQEPASDQHSVE